MQSPLQQVNTFTTNQHIHPAGAAQLGRLMTQSFKSASGQIQAFEAVHRLMDDGVDGILRFCDELGGEIRSLEGEGQQGSCQRWCESECKSVGVEIRDLAEQAVQLFMDSRSKHEQAVLLVKKLLVNFQEKFTSSRGPESGMAWEPLMKYLEDQWKENGNVGRARLLSQLLEPPFDPPAKEPAAKRRLADL